MLNGNKFSVLKQKKKGEFSISQITPGILKKYGINMTVSRFKNLAKRLPGRLVTTGSPFDVNKQRQTKLYDLNELSEIFKNWSDN